LGIVPTVAASGYGYIKADGANTIKTVSEFVEKPDAETAASYMEQNGAISGELGSHKWLWNSGMFLICADRYLEELKNFRADIYNACNKSMESTQQDFYFAGFYQLLRV
jgi:mannose-1-phosphate guanylyltransferase